MEQHRSNDRYTQHTAPWCLLAVDYECHNRAVQESQTHTRDTLMKDRETLLRQHDKEPPAPHTHHMHAHVATTGQGPECQGRAAPPIRRRCQTPRVPEALGLCECGK